MRGNSDPTAALIFGLAAGLWAFFKGFRVMREYKVLEDTPRIPIRSVPMGFVHIRGKAASEQVLSSPLSKTPCCFYRVEIDEWRSQGKSKAWKHICTDADGYRFYVGDETGKILIDAHAAEYDLPLGLTREVSSHNAPNPALIAGSSADNDLLQYIRWAQTHSMTDKVSQWIDKKFQKAGSADNPQLQAKQQALRDLFSAIPNATRGGRPPIEALERLAEASGPLSDPEKEQHRQMMLQRLHLAEAMQQSGDLSLAMPFSEPATGRFRLREYLVLPGQEYLVDGTCVENSAPDALDRAMIAKGAHEPTFLISSKTEKEVQHGLKKRAGLMILGGAALALACAAGLLFHLKMF
jgi:hypothetical protein